MPQSKYDLLPVLRQLFETELDLPPEPQRVFLYNQPWGIPPNQEAYGLISFLGSQTFGQSASWQTNPATLGLDYVQSINVREQYQFDWFSAGSEAEIRKQDPVFALKSYTAESLAEQYGFQIAYVTDSMLDTSRLEASRILYRYTYTFGVTRAIERTRPVPYYDKFPVPALNIQQ